MSSDQSPPISLAQTEIPSPPLTTSPSTHAANQIPSLSIQPSPIHPLSPSPDPLINPAHAHQNSLPISPPNSHPVSDLNPPASREGTNHTAATTATADQTLVDSSEPSPSLSPDPDPVPSTMPLHSSRPQTPTNKPKPPSTSNPLPPPAPPPAIPPPPPPAPHSQPTRSTPKPNKTPARKKLLRLLLPCFHSTAHDDDLRQSTRRRPTGQDGQEMAEPAARVSTPLGTRRSPVALAKQLKHSSKKPARPAAPIPRASRRTGSDQPLPTPVSDTVTPAGAAAATSAANAHGGGGVQLPIDETEGVLSGAVVPPGKDALAIKKSASASRLANRSHADLATQTELGNMDEGTGEGGEGSGEPGEDSEEDDEEDRIVAQGGVGIPVGEDGVERPLLAQLDSAHLGRKCLVLDLDETLVHSSFKTIPQSDFVVPVEIENAVHNVYVIKRPGVDQFMKRMGEIYEVVVFTASLSKYADPVLDMLDIHHVVKHRLFRESCYNHKGNYVKDLSQLGRPIGETIIIDNSPASYIFHPNNAVPVSSWFNDPHDTELTDLAAFLADIAHVPDVRGILDPRL